MTDYLAAMAEAEAMALRLAGGVPFDPESDAAFQADVFASYGPWPETEDPWPERATFAECSRYVVHPTLGTALQRLSHFPVQWTGKRYKASGEIPEGTHRIDLYAPAWMDGGPVEACLGEPTKGGEVYAPDAMRAEIAAKGFATFGAKR